LAASLALFSLAWVHVPLIISFGVAAAENATFFTAADDRSAVQPKHIYVFSWAFSSLTSRKQRCLPANLVETVEKLEFRTIR